MLIAISSVATTSSAHAQAELWRFESPIYQDDVGWSCSLVQDVDADGHPEALIGARGTTCLAPFDGKAVLASGAGGGVIDGWCGSTKDEGFGFAVTWVHDVDGGGRPDLVIGGPNYNEPTIGSRTGRIVMISGETHQPLWQLVGEFPGGNFGMTLANGGDLDGDGFDEIITSAVNYGGFFDGRVYVVSSKTVQTLRVHDGYPSDGLGRALAVLDDCDGDGIRDYVTYADNWNSTTLSDDGRVDVFSGATGNLVHSWIGLKAENLGLFLGSAGDWDGDGLGDVMCFLYDSTKSMNETVRVYSPATGAVLSEIANPDTKYSAFGSALGVVGDMDGDGFPEYAIGAYWHKHYGSKPAGCVYLYSGRNHRLLYQFLPGYDGGNFGWSFVGNDDLTGDGIPDLLIGAPAARNAQPKGGRLTAFAGNDLWLQAEPADALVGETIIVDVRNGEPNLLGLVVLVAVDGVATFDALLLAPFDANGELQLSADADASVSGMEFTLFAYAQNRAGRGPLLDSSPFVVTVQ
jgi:hypothetical protein